MEIGREIFPLIIIIRYVLFKLFIQIAVYTAVDLQYSHTRVIIIIFKRIMEQ